ncbi:universal stress protein [Streptomyces zaomyceticus]|uniref:universal stress protein n=1 Tax=Streptomyces zaomyceticus TaxID=68286 RepID=UPI0016783C77|nr:universal stress protein [Streptomyces zaomyceticus]GHG21430.1 hypothetical protein GCM10018791_40600 [Streptomyces zaomyceticus]
MTAQVTVGLDGSEESLAAAAWAATEAVLREVPLRLVHVEEWPNTPELPAPHTRTLAERAEGLLRDAAAEVARGMRRTRVTGRVRHRSPSAVAGAR